MQTQDSLVDLLTGVLWGHGGQLRRRDALCRAFDHALRMLIAQLGAGADDGPAKPLVQDLQRRTDCEGAARRTFSRFFLHAIFHPYTFSREFLSTDFFFAQNGVRFWLGTKTDPAWTWQAWSLREASKYTGGTAKVKQETRGEGPVGSFFISLGEWSPV